MPKYLFASAFSFVFVIAATAALHELGGMSETVAPAIAMVAALVVNFVVLRAWVFPGQTVHWGRQLAETLVTSVSFRVVEYAVFLGLHLGLGVNYLVATGASVMISALGKFGVYREVVFKRDRGARVPSEATAGAVAGGDEAPGV